MREFFTNWIAPLVIAGLVFAAAQSLLFQIADPEGTLVRRLAAEQVSVAEKTVDAHRQVVFKAGSRQAVVTDMNQNSYNPAIDGEYMAWVTDVRGAGQIMLHHIPSEATVQLTHSGTNVSPQISGGKVVWERWTDSGWQIFLFDGTEIIQITEGDTAVNPHIEGDLVVFARKNNEGIWRAEQFNIATGELSVVAADIKDKTPRLAGEQVVLFEPQAVGVPTTSSFFGSSAGSSASFSPAFTIVEKIRSDLLTPFSPSSFNPGDWL